MPAVYVILGLIAIIMVHEAGHFLVARMLGIRATKFFLFFPPTLWSFRRGDVEYGIGSIPLGGFVRLPGMFQPSGRDSARELEPLVDDVLAGLASPQIADRISTAFTELSTAANAGFVDRAARALLAAVEEARGARVAGSPPPSDEIDDRIWQRRARRLEERCRLLLDDVHPEAYWRAALWRRMAVIAAGPAVNILLAFVVLWGVFMLHEPVLRWSWQVATVTADSPAEQAGIRSGDNIVSWNGTRPGTRDRDVARFADVIEAGHGRPLDLVVRRDGKVIGVRLTPAPTKVPGTRRRDRLVGIGTRAVPEVHHHRRSNPLHAAGVAARVTWLNARYTVTGIVDRFRERNLDGVHTAVGVVEIADDVSREGALVHFLALLSLAIAIYNLLPILPLDGGHLAFGLIELLRRGRPASREAFARASTVGFVLLLLVFFAGLQNDLG